MARTHRQNPAALIRAATIFTSLSVVDALIRFVLPKPKIHQLMVSGGGARNPLLLAQLAAALGVGAQHVAPHLGGAAASSKIEVIPSFRLGIPVNAKEAFAFALLA